MSAQEEIKRRTAPDTRKGGEPVVCLTSYSKAMVVNVAEKSEQDFGRYD
jgi:hypothetical protein